MIVTRVLRLNSSSRLGYFVAMARLDPMRRSIVPASAPRSLGLRSSPAGRSAKPTRGTSPRMAQGSVPGLRGRRCGQQRVVDVPRPEGRGSRADPLPVALEGRALLDRPEPHAPADL